MRINLTLGICLIISTISVSCAAPQKRIQITQTSADKMEILEKLQLSLIELGYTINFVSENSGIVTTDWKDERSGFDRLISGSGLVHKFTCKLFSFSEGFNIDISLQIKNNELEYLMRKNQKQIINELMIKLKEHVAPNKVKLISI